MQVNNELSFKANLVRNIPIKEKNVKKFYEAKRIFEKKSEYDIGTLYLSALNKDSEKTSGMLVHIAKNKNQKKDTFITKSLNELLETMSPEDLAEKMLNIFKAQSLIFTYNKRCPVVLKLLDKAKSKEEAAIETFKKSKNSGARQRAKINAEKCRQNQEWLQAELDNFRCYIKRELKKVSKKDPEVEKYINVNFS